MHRSHCCLHLKQTRPISWSDTVRITSKYISDAAIAWLLHEDTESAPPLCDFDRIRYELRPCDVLLIEGRSHVSNVIRHISQSPWTHSCLYLGRIHDIDDPHLRERVASLYDGDPSDQLIIEGLLGSGTSVAPLSTYEKAHIRICRPAGLSRKDAQQVSRYCIGRLGTEYDIRQIFDLARFFLPWSILPRRWRSSIFSHHPGSYTKTVCSTVIAEAFTTVSFPILPAIKKTHTEDGKDDVELVHRNPRLFAPRDFDYSPYFEIIKYPFIQVVEKGLYRQLPWSKEGLISNDSEMINPNSLPRQNTDFDSLPTRKSVPAPRSKSVDLDPSPPNKSSNQENTPST